MGYNLLINGVYWGYNPLTNHLLICWDIQVEKDRKDIRNEDGYTLDLYNPPTGPTWVHDPVNTAAGCP